jgi:hypothetical protein
MLCCIDEARGNMVDDLAAKDSLVSEAPADAQLGAWAIKGRTFVLL